MDLSKFDVCGEFEKYNKYLSTCLKTPVLSEKEQADLQKVLEEITKQPKDWVHLSDKKNIQ